MSTKTRMAVAAVLAAVVATGVVLAAPPTTDPERLTRIEWMYRGYHLLFPRVEDIGVTELRDRLDRGDDLVLVDVRPIEERAVSVLPGAISLDELYAAEDAYRSRLVVTYCTVGARSGRVAGELLSEGWEVQNLEGSVLAWTHIGGELVDDEGRPTRRVHVYGERWNLVADGYEPVLTDVDGKPIPL